MTKFIAFHNNADLQKQMLENVAAHVAHDQVVQGKYGEGANGDFRGCFIGCTVHSLAGDGADYSSTKGVFEAYGFPAPLTKLCEAIFEGLPATDAPAFFKSVPTAMNLGADLSLVHWKFLHWMLVDTMAKHGTPDVRRGCAKSLSVINDLADGKKVTKARAARAADSAYSAADSAYYARAAYSAARAAYSARAANATAIWRKMAEAMLQFIGDAR